MKIRSRNNLDQLDPYLKMNIPFDPYKMFSKYKIRFRSIHESSKINYDYGRTYGTIDQKIQT